MKQNETLLFDIRQTNIAKGVAVLFLLWHHLFYNNAVTTARYSPLFFFNEQPVEGVVADLCKVCVAVFLLLSGYGLYKSYTKKKTHTLRADAAFSGKHLLRVMASYWLIFLIFVPLSPLFGRSFSEVYMNNPLNAIADFFGISYFVHDSTKVTMNATWWYMSILILFYLLYPLLHRLINFSPELLLSGAMALCFLSIAPRQIPTWLLPFVVGIYCAHYNLLERAAGLIDTRFKQVAVSGLLVIAFALLRYQYFNGTKPVIDFAFGFAVILFSFLVLSRTVVVAKILEEFGKLSGLIFMSHTFILMYFRRFVYYPKYAVLIFPLFAFVCFCVAWIIQKLMDVTRFSGWIKRLTA